MHLLSYLQHIPEPDEQSCIYLISSGLLLLYIYAFFSGERRVHISGVLDHPIRSIMGAILFCAIGSILVRLEWKRDVNHSKQRIAIASMLTLFLVGTSLARESLYTRTHTLMAGGTFISIALSLVLWWYTASPSSLKSEDEEEYDDKFQLLPYDSRHILGTISVQFIAVLLMLCVSWRSSSYNLIAVCEIFSISLLIIALSWVQRPPNKLTKEDPTTAKEDGVFLEDDGTESDPTAEEDGVFLEDDGTESDTEAETHSDDDSEAEERMEPDVVINPQAQAAAMRASQIAHTAVQEILPLIEEVTDQVRQAVALRTAQVEVDKVVTSVLERCSPPASDSEDSWTQVDGE